MYSIFNLVLDFDLKQCYSEFRNKNQNLRTKDCAAVSLEKLEIHKNANISSRY